MIEPLLHAERLLVHGQVDEAERIYAQTAANDPHNAIAVVGLARVAIERGDDRLAYRHACAALEIDRQNAAALRLEARLSEVMATRGESVDRPPWLSAPAPQSRPPAPTTPPALPAADSPAAPDPVAAERAAFARNPSMADHRARSEPGQRRESSPTPSPALRQAPPPAPREALPPRQAPPPREAPSPRRRSLLARLLGRR